MSIIRFSKNSVRVYPVKLKIGILYHMNNNFRNTVFKISVNVPSIVCNNNLWRLSRYMFLGVVRKCYSVSTDLINIFCHCSHRGTNSERKGDLLSYLSSYSSWEFLAPLSIYKTNLEGVQWRHYDTFQLLWSKKTCYKVNGNR